MLEAPAKNPSPIDSPPGTFFDVSPGPVSSAGSPPNSNPCSVQMVSSAHRGRSFFAYGKEEDASTPKRPISVVRSLSGTKYREQQALITRKDEEIRQKHRVRLFYGNNRLTGDDSKRMVVIDCAEEATDEFPSHLAEAEKKFTFWNRLYAARPVELILFPNAKQPTGFKLLLPFVPGETLTKFPSKRLGLLGGALPFLLKLARVVRHVHSQNMVILDITTNNFVYCRSNGRLYPIDGGLSAIIGQPIENIAANKNNSRTTFHVKKEGAINGKIKKYTQIPPECWYLDTPPLAHPSMDMYGMANLFKYLFDILIEDQSPKIQALLDQCLQHDPNLRPTIDVFIKTVEEQLALRLAPEKYAAASVSGPKAQPR
ncbi:MAG: hypothetical protein Q8R79_00210 [Legionellaceae bacterium]|nr:hypothetical protein [Legionellaceae bacterium]